MAFRWSMELGAWVSNRLVASVRGVEDDSRAHDQEDRMVMAVAQERLVEVEGDERGR
jgi:hypothetical protein